MKDDIARWIVSGVATAAFALAGCVSAKSPADITEVNPVSITTVQKKGDMANVSISLPAPKEVKIQPRPAKVEEHEARSSLKSGECNLAQTIRIISELRDANVLHQAEADELILRAVGRAK